MKAILGKKIGMTQVFADDGRKHTVTVISVADVVVSKHLRAKGSDQVSHVEIGIGNKKKADKASTGNYKEVGKVPSFKVAIKNNSESEVPAVGTVIGANIFAIGDKVNAIGTTKGKGFQGVVKRHNFRGGPNTHGGPTGKMRGPGSIGAGTTPGNVIKGKKMGGHMGDIRKTIQNLKIIDVNQEENLIAVSGSIPGANGTYILIKAVRVNK
jgi:large subunit ribosomal protein L3